MRRNYLASAVAILVVALAPASAADTTPFPSSEIDSLLPARDELLSLAPPKALEVKASRMAKDQVTGSWLKCPGARGVEDELAFDSTVADTRRWSVDGGYSGEIAVGVYPDPQTASASFACDTGEMRKRHAAETTADTIQWHGSKTCQPLGTDPLTPCIPIPLTGEARLVGNVIVEVETSRDAGVTAAVANLIAQRARRR
ncbi:MAG: hypothetical protein ACRC20_14835 [Segniliparus sp.]|uniref:hypothetical protein n=1 Tax=Segniliparus sp. TaxID=2804064 RepID=UPI003F3F1188